jgi:hypothetical protein
MAENCPHCGAELSLVRDAYCPQCRCELEATALPAQRPPPREYERHEAAGSAAHGDANRQRPLGISILAILHFGGGILLGALQFPLLANFDELQGPLRTVGLAPVLLVIGVGFLALLAIAAGVGMWLGRKWGWWLGTFYYVYAIARNAAALVTVANMADELAAGPHGPGYYYVKHAGRIVVHLLILLYFFKGNVLHYFGLEKLSKWKSISALVGVCLAIVGVFTVVAWFAS